MGFASPSPGRPANSPTHLRMLSSHPPVAPPPPPPAYRPRRHGLLLHLAAPEHAAPAGLVRPPGCRMLQGAVAHWTAPPPPPFCKLGSLAASPLPTVGRPLLPSLPSLASCPQAPRLPTTSPCGWLLMIRFCSFAVAPAPRHRNSQPPAPCGWLPMIRFSSFAAAPAPRHRDSQPPAPCGWLPMIRFSSFAAAPATPRYRNSNYQSKDIAHVQKHLAERMAFKVGGWGVHGGVGGHKRAGGYKRGLCGTPYGPSARLACARVPPPPPPPPAAPPPITPNTPTCPPC